MKKLILVSLVLASTGFAAEKRRTTTTTTRTTTAASYSDGTSRIGLGFATFGGGLVGGTLNAASVMVELNDKMALQPFFGIMGSSPFTFGGGAIFKYALHGGNSNGFHTGLGFALGTTAAGVGTSFFADIFPVLGMHFSLGGHVSNLMLSFDMGPIFHVTPAFNFQLTSLSAVGGASLHYMF